MLTNGYIVISDITGYTAYLKGSELEHAQDSLRSLLEVLIKGTKPPLVISRLEGDAVISYAPQAGFLQGQTLVEMLENTYVAFRNAREKMRLNTTCTCIACQNIPNLDLKFFVHHGTYMLQEMQKHTELVGNDVNVTFRLVKNQVREETGITAYAAYTSRAVEALGIGEFAGKMQRHQETFPDVGKMSLYIQDLAPVWEQARQRQRKVVERENSGFVLEKVIPAPPPLVWDYFTKPEYRMILHESEGMPVENRNMGRLDAGTVYICAHGDEQIRQAILDWHPFEYYTYETEMPMGMTADITMRFIPVESGRSTRVVGICSKPNGPFIARTLANSPLFKPKIIAGVQAGLDLLEERILEELESGTTVRPQATPVPEELVGEAVRSSLTENMVGE